MAVYRQVQVSFWQDAFILDLTPEEKYFYLYLMTNSKTSQCGVYELPLKVIEVETGYNRETIEKLLERFIKYNKIEYCIATREILIKNWLKYNSFRSPKVMACIAKELNGIKHIPFKRYCTNRLAIDSGEEEEKEEEETKEKEKEETPYAAIIDYLNQKTNSQYRHSGRVTRDLIKARWNDGFKLQDFLTVIDKKAAQWLNTPDAIYLRPQTLFGTKFESYLNQKGGQARDPTTQNSGSAVAPIGSKYKGVRIVGND